MKLNTPSHDKIYTHEGGVATPTDAFHQLKRSVLTCMLWENSFYSDKFSIANRIAELVPQVEPEAVAALAVEARDRMNLRHVPLFLLRELARTKPAIAGPALAHVIQRADELSEFLAIYWKDREHGDRSRAPIASAIKRALAAAFGKFDEYQLAKYDRAGKIKLRDVMRLVHPKPKNVEQAALWKRLLTGSMATPDTWEVALSAGADKKKTFERLLREKKLGGMATLRNLRNMQEARVDESLIRERLESGCGRALPFRFIVAARHAPRLEDAIEKAMLASVRQQEPLPGKTLLVIDTSGSMDSMLSAKSESTRIDTACGLAILVREVAENCVIYATAGNDGARTHATAEIPSRRGFPLADAIRNNHLGRGGIYFQQCMDFIAPRETHSSFDRVIVITDEQDCDKKNNPMNAKKLGKFNYVINISVEANGISYRNGWQHIDGWSERVIDYIREIELCDGDRNEKAA